MKYNDNQLQLLLADSRYQDIGALPSQFKGYDWNTMFIRPFGIKEFKLVSKAAALKDMTHMIRAIDLVITQDAKELTIGDFYYVMMWLRIHSIPKTPVVVSWECGERVLVHKETNMVVPNEDPYPMPDDLSLYREEDCGTHNTEAVYKSDIEILSLDEEGEEKFAKQVLPAGFDFPRAKHIEGLGKALADPERVMLTAAAQWVAGETVVDKFKRMEDADDETGMEMLDTGTALNELMQHGLKEVVQIKCRRCMKAEPYHVNLTPTTFFP